MLRELKMYTNIELQEQPEHCHNNDRLCITPYCWNCIYCGDA